MRVGEIVQPELAKFNEDAVAPVFKNIGILLKIEDFNTAMPNGES